MGSLALEFFLDRTTSTVLITWCLDMAGRMPAGETDEGGSTRIDFVQHGKAWGTQISPALTCSATTAARNLTPYFMFL